MKPLAGQTLEAVCRLAHETATARGRPLLAHHAFPLPGANPLTVLAALAERQPFRFYWERPSQGLAIAAGGNAQGFRVNGPDRFHKMSIALETAQHLAARGEEGGAALGFPPGPLAVGGFSFFDQLQDPAWEGFAAAEMVIPAWVVLARGAEVRATVTVMATAGQAEADLLAAMAGQRELLEQAASGTAEAPGPEGFTFSPLDGENGHQDWLGMVSAAAADIRAGELEKVVLARAVRFSCAPAPAPYPILRHLRDTYPDCYTFLIDPGRGQFFLGATPERLVSTDGKQVALGALAGTAARGEHEAADEALAGLLMAGRKERLEHDIVVDAIVAAVRDLGEVERPPEPEILRLDNLQHLFTPLTLRAAKPVKLLKLVERLHPTPAVGGQPREASLRKLRAYEGFERGWYAAPVGWMDAAGNGEFAVALRSALFSGEQVRAFAGNGILADSDPEREYLETQLKLRPILAAFAHE